MSESVSGFVDATRLLVDLQQVSTIVQSLKGYREPEAIAKRATDGLVDTFGCAFARIWLMEADGAALRLVASSGMYTHTDGFFARVPVGAFKVGKIARNRIPFLSNNLADEPWVKDREWAIAHSITGFAGYPLAIGEKVVGVLAVFSHQPLSPEFLEVLQGLCTTLAVMLENSLYYQQHAQTQFTLLQPEPLSEQIATLLPQARLNLVGTEYPLSPSITYLLLQAAEVLSKVDCTYCRLSYGVHQISLDAMASSPRLNNFDLESWATSALSDLQIAVNCAGGVLQTSTGSSQKVMQIALQIPYQAIAAGPTLQIRLSSPVLQLAFTRLSSLAGLTVSSRVDPTTPLLTDDLIDAASSQRVLWFARDTHSIPKNAIARVDLTITPEQFREAVEAAIAGTPWNVYVATEAPATLSEREQEILRLLGQGLRDRDIADRLIISESTVKFHMNNVVTKLKARTRYQAIYQAIVQGWI